MLWTFNYSLAKFSHADDGLSVHNTSHPVTILIQIWTFWRSLTLRYRKSSRAPQYFTVNSFKFLLYGKFLWQGFQFHSLYVPPPQKKKIGSCVLREYCLHNSFLLSEIQTSINKDSHSSSDHMAVHQKLCKFKIIYKYKQTYS